MRPEDTIKHSLAKPSDWADFKALRLRRNEEINEWAASLRDMDLEGMLVWYPGDGSARIEKSKALCVMQLFNHQTHHRGQIHAMLTAAGAKPDPTDLQMLDDSSKYALPGWADGLGRQRGAYTKRDGDDHSAPFSL